jgi:glycosyltransferase involved in cell wall biosynthesis
LNWEANAVKRYEQMVIKKCDFVTIISEQDKQAISNNENIAVIPNGVDVEHYVPMPDSSKQYDIVFVGRMSYAPNINAATFLVKQIMPHVWRCNPGVKVLIAGACPPHSVKSLQNANVTVNDWTPDMRQCYASAKMMVAPMQIGGGLQNKLLEAMAMQIPCITSSLANNSLNAIDGEQILVANTPKDFADKILLLLNDKGLSKTLSGNGRAFVEQHYSWQSHNEHLKQIIRNIVRI